MGLEDDFLKNDLDDEKTIIPRAASLMCSPTVTDISKSIWRKS